MQTESGKLYINKTWLYLYPCLKYYGEDLKKSLNSFLKLGVGISDHNLNIENGSNNIFILFDTEPKLNTPMDREKYKQNFEKFLDWLRYQHYYVTDYVYEELKHSGKHMVVIKIPRAHDLAIVNFIQGKYSQMYTPKDLNTYFNFSVLKDKEREAVKNKAITAVRNVLTKDKVLLEDFVLEVNSRFGTEATKEDLRDAELDFPPVLDEETFNY